MMMMMWETTTTTMMMKKIALLEEREFVFSLTLSPSWFLSPWDIHVLLLSSLIFVSNNHHLYSLYLSLFVFIFGWWRGEKKVLPCWSVQSVSQSLSFRYVCMIERHIHRQMHGLLNQFFSSSSSPSMTHMWSTE